MRYLWVVIISTLFFSPLSVVGEVFATEYTSPSFKILDPVIDSGGTAYSTTSSGLLQLGSVGELSVGRSNSANFELRAGFLFFPAPPSTTSTGGGGGGSIIMGSGSGGRVPPGIIRQQLRRPSCVDLNDDQEVGLIDVSIMFFAWYPKEESEKGVKIKNKRPDCNNDDLVNIVDLSVLLFWWDEIN